MKKVLIYGYSGTLGGIEVFLRRLILNMSNKYKFILLLDFEGEFPYERELIEKCDIVRITNRKKNYQKYLKQLRAVILQKKPDIVHINLMTYSNFELIKIAKKYSNANVIVHSHNAGYKKGYIKTRLIHQIGKLLVSKEEFTRFACGEKAGRYLFGRKQFEIINNGIPFNDFRFDRGNRERYRNILSVEDDEVLIGHVGRFVEIKNHSFLLDVFYEFKKKQKSKLLLIGSGQLEGAIMEKIKRLKIEKDVIILKGRDDINALLSAMDVFVMPSLSEGLSISICEAQVNGLKCVTSDMVDKASDISGNTVFLSLGLDATDWAKELPTTTRVRPEPTDKIPKEFDMQNSLKIISKYYNMEKK